MTFWKSFKTFQEMNSLMNYQFKPKKLIKKNKIKFISLIMSRNYLRTINGSKLRKKKTINWRRNFKMYHKDNKRGQK